MTRVIRSVAEVSPEQLTVLLRDAGRLTGGSVSVVDVQITAAFNSVVAYLELTYTEGAAGPPALVLKLNADARGQEEAAFYQLVTFDGTARKCVASMLIPCVDAASDADSGASHLVLVDVSETHEPTVTRESLLALNGVPPQARLLGVIAALARFHATWWEHPLLNRHPATLLAEARSNKTASAQRWQKHRRDYDSFTQAHGEGVSAETRALYERVLDAHETIWTRYLEPRIAEMSNLTLTHNDCYSTQFLSPRTGTEPTYLVDFQSVGTDFAARDLVYLLATFWTREQRRRFERKLLTHYHQVLTKHGVSGYNLETLFDDYRLALTDMIFHPVWDTTYGADPLYWRPKLHCLLNAYKDWDCAELLTRKL